MKKIIFTIHSMRLGGAERVLSIIANALVQEDYDVTIITMSNQGVYHDLDERVTLIPLGMDQNSHNIFDAVKYNLLRVKKLTQLFKEIAPDIVVSFTITVNITSTIASKFSSIPIIISERSNPWEIEIPYYWRVLAKYIFPLAQYIVVQTERTKDFYKKYNVPMQKIYNPLIVEEQYTPLRHKERKKIILGVGRLNDIKRFDLLIESFSQVKNRDGWKLVILGEGKERVKLEQLIEKLNLHNSVILKGMVKNVNEYMKESSIFVLTSRHEGFPNVLCESMMYGMAAISFDCETGPSEMIHSGINGMLLENGNVKQLTNSIENLIQHEDLRQELSVEALKIAKELHQDKIIAEWKLLIDNVISMHQKS